MWWLIKVTMILKTETGTGSLASLGIKQTFQKYHYSELVLRSAGQQRWTEAEEILEQFCIEQKIRRIK